jgi:phenylacetate-CoA ligase
MRSRIAEELGVELYDIYGLTEIYGPGIGINCPNEPHMHYWDDYLYFEVVDPKTGRLLPDGQMGELVITTLKKQGAPLIRYRTHDLTRIIPEACSCGSPYPRIGTILGRTDDMVKVKGSIIFPSLIDELLKSIPGASSEYQVMIDHMEGKDILTLFVEKEPGADTKQLAEEIREQFKAKVGVTAVIKPVGLGELPRSEKKSTRIYDNRY